MCVREREREREQHKKHTHGDKDTNKQQIEEHSVSVGRQYMAQLNQPLRSGLERRDEEDEEQNKRHQDRQADG